MTVRRSRHAVVAAGLALAAVAPSAALAQRAPSAAPQAAQPAPTTWPVRTREHVDLWLHGFALVLDDTAQVPLFRRGYRETMRPIRARANAFTRLDAERDRLRARFTVNPQLALTAQFVPLAFASWEELKQAVDGFLAAQGDPRRASDARLAGAVAYLAQTFPAPADREWLRVFAGALQDERDRFYHQYWTETQRDRSPALAAADSVWQRQMRPRLQRFLNNTQQAGGELELSLVLGGEGRTQSGGKAQNLVVVGFPATVADAPEASYAAVHEVVGSLVGSAVADNTSPAEQRAGVADRYVSAGQVRVGYELLRRVAADLAPGYARFYLQQAGAPAPASGAAARDALATTFALPAPLLDSITRQLDVVLGGI